MNISKECLINILKSILALFLLATAEPSHALEVGYIAKSKHFTTTVKRNETNPGLYIMHKKYIGGAYKNSYFTTTSFAGCVSSWRYMKGLVRFSIGYGLAYGYGWNHGVVSPKQGGAKVTPFVLPTIAIKQKDTYTNLHIFDNAVALSFSKSFK